MENDKRLTKTLTEGAVAPRQSEGTIWDPCNGGPECPDYPSRCNHNDLIASHRRMVQALTDRRAAIDSGEKWHGWESDLEYWGTRYIEANALLIASDIRHQQRKAYLERQDLHATNKANAESKRGPWEFTLTYSPKEHGWNSDQAKETMRSAIERLTRYYREEIEEFHAVGELTQSGQPHVHAWYRLDGGRRITTKSFRRAYPIWNERRKLGRGHEGGHHEPVVRTSDFDGYIEKHLDTAWLDIHITNEYRPQEAHVSEEDDEAEGGTPV